MIDLAAIEQDLVAAYRARLVLRRRKRRVQSLAAIVAVASIFSAAAIASDVGVDLQLDPTKWLVLGSGAADGGKGSYVHAVRKEDGSNSTFMVEHDAGLEPYQAFLLHEDTKAAADATSPVPVRAEPGDLCSPDQLTRAEVIALQTLAALPSGTSVAAAKKPVGEALASSFRDDLCRGLEYAGERARFVWAGMEPKSLLMKGAR